MAQNIVVKTELDPGKNYRPFGTCLIWYVYNKGTKAYRAYIGNSNNNGYPIGLTDYEFLGVAGEPPGWQNGWQAQDELELMRYCDGTDLVVVTSGIGALDFISTPTLDYLPGDQLASYYGWKSLFGPNSRVYGYKDVVYGGKMEVTTPEGCALKCDIQLIGIEIVDNLDSIDLLLDVESSYPPVQYGLVTGYHLLMPSMKKVPLIAWGTNRVLTVDTEGTYEVMVRDAKNCDIKQTVEVKRGDLEFKPRYKATFRDNDDAPWTVLVDERDYTGEVEIVDLMENPVRIKWNKQGDNKLAVIKGSECELSVESKESMQFLSLFTSESNKYRMRLVEGVYVNDGEILPNGWFTNAATYNSVYPFVFGGGKAVITLGSTSNTSGSFSCTVTVQGGKKTFKTRVKASGDSGDMMEMRFQITGVTESRYFKIDNSWHEIEFLLDGFGFAVFYISFYFPPQGEQIIIEVDYLSLKYFNKVVWQGLISTEAYEEPYTCAPYGVDFTFYDGLGKLKELDFETPLRENYTGIKSEMQAVCILLLKTGLQLKINVAIDLFELRMNSGEGQIPLTQAYINMDAFLKEDNTPRDCYTCMEMILSKYGAQVYQRDGEWWIVEADIKRVDEENRGYMYYTYSAHGSYLGSGTVEEMVQHTAADADPRVRFVHESQRMTMKPAYKEITVEMTTGLQAVLNANNTFSQEGENGQPIAGWTDTTGLLSVRSVQDAKTLRNVGYFAGDGEITGFTKEFEMNPLRLVAGSKGARLSLMMNARVETDTWNVNCFIRLKIALEPYWLDQSGKWVAAETHIDVPMQANEAREWRVTTDALPVSGLLRVRIFQAYVSTAGVDAKGFEIKDFAVSYNQISGRADDPVKVKLENDGAYNYVPSVWKIGFGDVIHENAAFMFRNAIYLDKVGNVTTKNWYRRGFSTANPHLTNGNFIGLAPWTNEDEGFWFVVWQAYGIQGVYAQNNEVTDAVVSSDYLVQTLVNNAGAVEVSVKASADIEGCRLVIMLGDRVEMFDIVNPEDEFEGTYTIQAEVEANVTLKIQAIFNSPGAIVSLGGVSVKDVTKLDTESVLGSMNGKTIQQILAEKMLAAYYRPMQQLNGRIATRNCRLRMGNIFRDTYNLSGEDYAITAMTWDVERCEHDVEMVEFSQLNVVDNWLLTEDEQPILDENLNYVIRD